MARYFEAILVPVFVLICISSAKTEKISAADRIPESQLVQAIQQGVVKDIPKRLPPLPVISLTLGLYNTFLKPNPTVPIVQAINEALPKIDAHLEAIKVNQGTILNTLHHLQNLLAYHADYKTLTNYIRQYTDFLNRGATIPESWYDEVLSWGPDGLNQVVANFDSFVGGATLSTSVLLSYEKILINTHSRSSQSYYDKLVEFVDYITAIQISGYGMYRAALEHRGQNTDFLTNQLSRQLDEQNDMVNTLKARWPTGSWGIPYVAATGCPISRGFSFSSGNRKHSSGLDAGVSNSQHFPQPIAVQMTLINDEYTGGLYFLPMGYVTQHFCMKTSASGGSGDWPKGNYCIFVYGSACPTGFQCGYVGWDDFKFPLDPDNVDRNTKSGTLPNGQYGYPSMTLIQYACREDGPASTPIVLPSIEPFFLLRYSSACQQVAHTTVTDEYIEWSTGDGSGTHGPHPSYGAYGYSPRKVKIHYCYYKSTMYQ